MLRVIRKFGSDLPRVREVLIRNRGKRWSLPNGDEELVLANLTDSTFIDSFGPLLWSKGRAITRVGWSSVSSFLLPI